MAFPIKVTSIVSTHCGELNKELILHKGFSVLVGPNGSGKTHILRGLKKGLKNISESTSKKIRYLSSGRMGMLEQYRSDFDGQRGETPSYDVANYGSTKNLKMRHASETINGDILTLAVRTDILLKVQERLNKIFRRDLDIVWDAGALKINFSRTDCDIEPYSSGREASGLMHLVAMLAALYDDEVGVLLIDEPEVSLHPQYQAFLLREMQYVSGYPSPTTNKKIIIIATHSTEMIQIKNSQDLLSIIFCNDLTSELVQIKEDASELQGKKLNGLISRLGQEHKLSLFSKHPLLVEGITDFMICKALTDKADLYLEAAGCQLLPVTGKGEMPIVTKLFRLLGKTPIVLADADAFTDNLDLVNTFIINNEPCNGFKDIKSMAKDIYQSFCKLVDEHWVQLSNNAMKNYYWINQNESCDDKTKRRAVFCTLFTMDDDELKKIDIEWMYIKNRLNDLLKNFEKHGLFFLRLGTIECYFDNCINTDKLKNASEEVNIINSMNLEDLLVRYEEILNCLRFSSQTEPINEADAIKEFLVAVISSAQVHTKSPNKPGIYPKSLNGFSKKIIGDKSNIFDINFTETSINVSLVSNILQIDGFPLSIPKEEDPIKFIITKLY